MAKSKKTKIHKKIDGQILQMNKQFSNLKMKQKDKITGWAVSYTHLTLPTTSRV